MHNVSNQSLNQGSIRFLHTIVTEIAQSTIKDMIRLAFDKNRKSKHIYTYTNELERLRTELTQVFDEENDNIHLFLDQRLKP